MLKRLCRLVCVRTCYGRVLVVVMGLFWLASCFFFVLGWWSVGLFPSVVGVAVAEFLVFVV